MITEPADWKYDQGPTERWHSHDRHDRKNTPKKKRGRSKSGAGQLRNTRYNQEKQYILEGTKRSAKVEALFLNTHSSGEHHIDLDTARDHDSEKMIKWFTDEYVKKGKKAKFIMYEDTPETKDKDKAFKVRVNCIWSSKSSAINHPPDWLNTHVKTTLVKWNQMLSDDRWELLEDRVPWTTM